MKLLRIQSTDVSPYVEFDPIADTCTISGMSILTQVEMFYSPLIEWLRAYCEDPGKSLVFDFRLQYYNLASSKRFMFLIYMLNKVQAQGCDVKVIWHYCDDDDFMKEFGEDLSDLFKVDFELAPFGDAILKSA